MWASPSKLVQVENIIYLSNKHSHIIPNHTTRCQVISRSVVLTIKCSSVYLKNPVSNTEANLSRPRCLQNAMIRFLTVLTAFNKHYVSYILNFIVSTCFDICHCFANMKNVDIFSLKSFYLYWEICHTLADRYFESLLLMC